jgi:hypothetical protein
MPIGVLEMNPAIPHAALTTTPLSRSFAGYLLLRNSLAQPFCRLLRKLFHGNSLKSEVQVYWLMIPQAGNKFVLQPTLFRLWRVNRDLDLVMLAVGRKLLLKVVPGRRRKS